MRLLLLRHAKSDWRGADEMDDHDRPLAARGRNAARKIGAYMRDKGLQPALVWSSTAKRARDTVALVVPELGGALKVTYRDDLYLAEWPELLESVRKAPPKASPLLIVGHNPGMEQLALALCLRPRTAAERARAQSLAHKFPTAALAVLKFENRSWRAIKPGAGRLVDFVRPKDLGKAGDSTDDVS